MQGFVETLTTISYQSTSRRLGLRWEASWLTPFGKPLFCLQARQNYSSAVAANICCGRKVLKGEQHQSWPPFVRFPAGRRPQGYHYIVMILISASLSY